MNTIKLKFNKQLIIVFIIGLLIGGGIVFLINQREIRNEQDVKEIISAEEAKERILNFARQQMPPGATASVINIISERGLYKITINLKEGPQEERMGQEMDVYLTKDGVLLFPQAINLVEMIGRQEEVRKDAEFQTALTSERKEKIAKCLTEKGIRVYVADWCPFCQQQKELFGEAAKYLNSIDCHDPTVEGNNIAKCPDIRGVPAWRDGGDNELRGPNEEVIDGLIQTRRLVEISGCNF